MRRSSQPSQAAQAAAWPGSNTHSLNQHSLRHHVYRVNSIYHTAYYTFQKIDGSVMIRNHPTLPLLVDEAEDSSDVQEPSLPPSFPTSDQKFNDFLWSLLTDRSFDISVIEIGQEEEPEEGKPPKLSH